MSLHFSLISFEGPCLDYESLGSIFGDVPGVLVVFYIVAPRVLVRKSRQATPFGVANKKLVTIKAAINTETVIGRLGKVNEIGLYGPGERVRAVR